MKFGLGDFWWTAKIILRKGKYTLPPVFNATKARLFSFSKTNLCDENVSNNFSLHDSDIYLPVFPCGNNRKLYIIAITLKLVKKGTINFDLSKLPGPDCIPVVVQKKCEPELLYILV